MLGMLQIVGFFCHLLFILLTFKKMTIVHHAQESEYESFICLTFRFHALPNSKSMSIAFNIIKTLKFDNNCKKIKKSAPRGHVRFVVTMIFVTTKQ